jgi:hypothetical protein
LCTYFILAANLVFWNRQYAGTNMRPFPIIAIRGPSVSSPRARQRVFSLRQSSTSALPDASSSPTNAIIYSLTAVVISVGIWSSGYKQGYDLVAGTQQKPTSQALVASPVQGAVIEETKPVKKSVAAPPKQDIVVPEPGNPEPAQEATETSTQGTAATSATSTRDVTEPTEETRSKASPQDAIIEKHLATIAQLEETTRLQFQELQKQKKLVQLLRDLAAEQNEVLKASNEAIQKLKKSKNYPQLISGTNNRQR